LPLGGNVQDGEIVADFGIDAALLFGRQKAKTHHQSTGRYGLVSVFRQTAVPHTTAQFPATPDHTRSRNVTVPNIGGSVGLSWRLQNFKMSLGYKADFFFGAIDGGIDTRKSENRGFFGPFASVSVGLGD
jgi:iron complex outermembrane recepter protein